MNARKVRNESDLRLYLTRKWWDMIIIDEGINLNEPIIIDRDVDLTGSPNGAIFSTFTDSGNEHSLFVVKKTTNFYKMRINMIPNMAGWSSAIKFDSPYSNCVIRKSQINGFSWGSIWGYNIDRLTVQDCSLIGNRGTSFNYGVWQGGKSDAPEQTLYFNNNFVSNVRHAIGSSYHPNSYYAIGNTISTLKHSFDRHNWNSGGRKGGLHTVISGNTFLDPDRLAFSIEPPYEGGSFVFTGNNLNHSSSRHVGEIAEVRVYEGEEAPNTSIHSNRFLK